MLAEEWRVLVASDMSQVDELIRSRLGSEVALINQMANYIINSGGKRLRPHLVLLSAHACNYQGQRHIDIAAIVEFIHTATLLHDDVVDASDLRRGSDTANSLWGNEAAVLVGDFLYSRSFEMMVTVSDLDVMGILAETTNRIAEGEVMQLLNMHEAGLSENDYLTVIRAKTARLFEAATRLSAVLAGVDETWVTALADYGLHLGTAFQIADDVLDYASDNESLGKEIGDDLAEGKPTLPLIIAMRDGNDQQRLLIREAIENGGRQRIGDVMTVIVATDALSKSMDLAAVEADAAIKALQVIPESRYREALETLAHYSAQRLS